MGSLSIISAGLCLKLRETNGMVLVDTLQEFYEQTGNYRNIQIFLICSAPFNADSKRPYDSKIHEPPSTIVLNQALI